MIAPSSVAAVVVTQYTTSDSEGSVILVSSSSAVLAPFPPLVSRSSSTVSSYLVSPVSARPLTSPSPSSHSSYLPDSTSSSDREAGTSATDNTIRSRSPHPGVSAPGTSTSVLVTATVSAVPATAPVVPSVCPVSLAGPRYVPVSSLPLPVSPPFRLDSPADFLFFFFLLDRHRQSGRASLA